MKKGLFLIAVFLSVSFLLSAEETDEADAGSLYLKTIAMDIQTAGFFELISWCGRLELPADGSAEELRTRLYRHYQVTPEKDQSRRSSGIQITIEKADNLEYFTIENVDENYVRITGGVNLRLYDETKKETHIIKADTLLFNFKENFLTATGNIQYALEGETKTEYFKGEKITFNIDDSAGLFDRGITEQEQKIKEEDFIFYFKGDLINKTFENYVVLENGEITSCDFSDPHYKIKASKIWLLTGSDWAILNGIVYIGRVPMFYFPAFLYPGDDIFINPVFGFRADYGYYLQTSTYLVGRKEKDKDSLFSFMQSENAEKYYKLQGLYLTEDKNPSDFSKTVQDYGDSDKYIKILLDYYTNLGFYAALDLKLPKPSAEKTENSFLDFLISFMSVVENTELYASVARTRRIEQNGGSYTVLFPDENNVYGSIWEESYLYNTALPFRYGLNYTTSINFNWMNINLKLTSYSDRDYTKDFADRSENLDLLSLLSIDTNTTEGSGVETSRYEWNAAVSIKPDLKILNPWVNSLSINTNTSLNWLSKEITKTDGGYENTVEYFFYPDNYIFPSITGTALSGQLIPLKKTKETETADETGPEKEGLPELRAPWEEAVPAEEINVLENLPKQKGDIPIDTGNYWTDTDIYTNKLTYSIKPGYSDKTQLNTSGWTVPEQIDPSDIEYSFRTASFDAGLEYNAYLFGKLLGLTNSLNMSLDYNEHYNMDVLSEETINKYLLEDNRNKDLNIRNNLKLSTAPLVFLDFLNKTEIIYNFNSYIYKYDYSDDSDSFIGSYFQADEDHITEHKITYNMPFEFSEFSQNISISTTLPPLDLITSGSLKVVYRISSTELNTAVKQSSDEYIYEPLTINETLLFNQGNQISNSISYNYSDLQFEKDIFSGNLSFFGGKFKASSKMEYDFRESVVNTFNVNMSLFDSYIDFSAANTYKYIFNPGTGWIQDTEKTFLPTKLVSGIKIKPDTLKFWKNRVDIDIDLDSKLTFDLIKYNNSRYDLTFGLTLGIFEFLDLEFKSVSENTAIYRYIPSYCSELGVNHLDILTDLFKSFNFADINERYESNFNLKSLSIGFKHDLHDWDLNVEYTGKPYLNTAGDYPVYDWENSLNIFLKWKAIPDIKSEIKIDNEDVSF